MAAGDYNVADRNITALTAGERVEETVQATPDAEAQEWADAAGVSAAAYANYATALDAFTDRADIESLAARRAREAGTEFSDGDFMRQAAYNEDGTAADAPRPGTVYGDAPDNGVDDLGTEGAAATEPAGYGDGDPATPA